MAATTGALAHSIDQSAFADSAPLPTPTVHEANIQTPQSSYAVTVASSVPGSQMSMPTLRTTQFAIAAAFLLNPQAAAPAPVLNVTPLQPQIGLFEGRVSAMKASHVSFEHMKYQAVVHFNLPSG